MSSCDPGTYGQKISGQSPKSRMSNCHDFPLAKCVRESDAHCETTPNAGWKSWLSTCRQNPASLNICGLRRATATHSAIALSRLYADETIRFASLKICPQFHMIFAESKLFAHECQPRRRSISLIVKVRRIFSLGNSLFLSCGIGGNASGESLAIFLSNGSFASRQ